MEHISLKPRKLFVYKQLSNEIIPNTGRLCLNYVNESFVWNIFHK